MKKITLIVLSIFLISLRLNAAEKEHPIEQRLARCTDANPTTPGMINCTEKAAEEWDAEMNRVYSALMKEYKGDDRAAALKESQREWIVFRDSELKAIDRIYEHLEGTMYLPMRVYSRLRLTKERAELLANYLDLAREQ